VGCLSYWRQRDIDFGLTWYLFVGGMLGAIGEMFFLDYLDRSGFALKTNIALIYVIVLGAIGMWMLYVNIKALLNTGKNDLAITMRHWMIYFPWHRIFSRARVEMSVLIPLLVGIMTGFLTSTLGGGNGLFMMPIVAYLIGRSSPSVAGTTMLSGYLIAVAVTIIHGISHSPSDWCMITIIFIGSSIGSQIGVRIRYKLPSKSIGILGSLVVLLICLKFVLDLIENGVQSHIDTPLSGADFLSTALYTAPSWALGVIKFAYYYPLLYTLVSVVGITVMGFCMERFLQKYIVIKTPRKR
jgi:uncharacterized membrane protein YfcA